jgi:hypothetical protein
LPLDERAATTTATTQLYQYSVKIEMTAKGLAMPTIHVYSNDMETARKQAVEQYTKVIEDLKAKGLALQLPTSKYKI